MTLHSSAQLDAAREAAVGTARRSSLLEPRMTTMEGRAVEAGERRGARRGGGMEAFTAEEVVRQEGEKQLRRKATTCTAESVAVHQAAGMEGQRAAEYRHGGDRIAEMEQRHETSDQRAEYTRHPRQRIPTTDHVIIPIAARGAVTERLGGAPRLQGLAGRAMEPRVPVHQWCQQSRREDRLCRHLRTSPWCSRSKY